MADFIFKLSPNIVVSSYGISRLGEYARERGSKYIVIMDRLLKEVAIYEKITKALDERKIEYFVFDELSDGATTQIVERALTLAREGHVHGVIAVGGAKAIHAGQVVAALYNESHDFYDYVDGSVPTTAPIACICVPTTLREVFVYTQYAPLGDSRSKQIKLLNLKQPVCSLVLIDPTLVAMLTENQKMTMALEAVCLACEAYLSQKATFFSDMLAEKAIELLSYALDGSPTLEISIPRDELLTQAGCMASLAAAISAPGVCSLLAMALNVRFEISSSLSVAILFPHFIEDAGNYKNNRIEKLMKLFRVPDSEEAGNKAASVFAENLRMRMASIKLPARLKELGLPIDQLVLAVEDAGQLPLMNSLSRSMSTDDLFAMIKTAF